MGMPPVPGAPARPVVAAPALAPAAVVLPPESSAVASANTALGLMGDSGTGKTLLIGTFAEWLWETAGKRTRFLAFDPGGYPDYIRGLINLGILVPWRPMSRDPDCELGLILGTIDRACRGYWPVEFTDPLMGNTAPGCDLVPSQTTTFVLVCPNGHDLPPMQSLQMAADKQEACPKCGVLTTQQNCLRIRPDIELTAGFEEFGGIAFDGLTSMSTWAMVEMNLRAGHNLLGGIKGATNTQTSDGIIYGQAGMSGVGFAQQRVWEWITNATKIAGLLRPPIFTALKARGKDEGEGVLVYGPQVAGKAITSQLPAWFGNILGTEVVMVNGVAEYRLYLRQYYTPPDPGRHLINCRISGLEIPDYLADPSGSTAANGKQFSVFSLGYFYRDLWDKSVAAIEDSLAKRMKRTPPGPLKALPVAAQQRAVKAQPWSLSGGGGVSRMPSLGGPVSVGGPMPPAPGSKVMPPPPGGPASAAPPAAHPVAPPLAPQTAAPPVSPPPAAPPAAPKVAAAPAAGARGPVAPPPGGPPMPSSTGPTMPAPPAPAPGAAAK